MTRILCGKQEPGEGVRPGSYERAFMHVDLRVQRHALLLWCARYAHLPCAGYSYTVHAVFGLGIAEGRLGV